MLQDVPDDFIVYDVIAVDNPVAHSNGSVHIWNISFELWFELEGSVQRLAQYLQLPLHSRAQQQVGLVLPKGQAGDENLRLQCMR